MKWIFLSAALSLTGVVFGAGSGYISAENAGAWRVQPKTAGHWLETDSSAPVLVLDNPGGMQPFWIFDLKEFRKGTGYFISGEVRAAKETLWRVYVEAGRGAECENFGILKFRPGAGEWSGFHFTGEFKRMAGVPYIVLQSMEKGTVEFRNLKAEELRNPGEVLKNGESLNLLSPAFESGWSVSGGKAEAEDGKVKFENPSDKTVFRIFRNLGLEKGSSYRMECKVEGTPGMKYRIYLESMADGKCENAGVRTYVADGKTQTVSFSGKINLAPEKAYLVFMLHSAGTLSVSDFSLKKEESTLEPDKVLNSQNGWRILPENAGRKTAGAAGELELGSASGNRIVAESGSFVTEPNQSYRLEFDAAGVQGKGDLTGSSFFRVRLHSENEDRLIPESKKRFDCLPSLQKKTLRFRTASKDESLRIRIELEEGSAVRLGGFRLAKEESVDAGEILPDQPLSFQRGYVDGKSGGKISGKASGKGVLELKDGKGNLVASRKIAGKEMEAFSFPAPPAGEEYVLFRNGEKKMNFKNPPEGEPNFVNFNGDGILMTNGKAFFPILHWETTSRGDLDSEMAFLKEAGFNGILWRGVPGALELARKHNLKMVMSLPESLPESEGEKQLLAAQLKRFAKDPSVLALYHPDEPMWRGVGAETLRELYEFAGVNDPNHPVWLNEAPRGNAEEMAEYARFSDVFGVDIYPFPEGNSHSELEDKGLTATGKYTDLSKQAVRNGKPVWMILQAFAWDYKKGLEASGYPDYHSSRFMAYNAITHGATGLLYHYLGYTPLVPDGFWHDLRKVVRELAGMQDVLAGETIAPSPVKAPAEGGPFGILTKRVNGTDYHIICNESKNSGTFSFSMDKSSDGIYHVLLEPEKISVKNGVFQIAMAGRDVKVLSKKPFPSSAEIWRTEDETPYSRGLRETPAMELLRKSSWIWYPGRNRIPGEECLAKCTFDLPEVPAEAVLIADADDLLLSVSVNGTEVMRGREKSFSGDIGNLLKRGLNTVEIEACDSGKPPCGLLAVLRGRMKDGKFFDLVSDRRWTMFSKTLNQSLPAEELGKFGCAPWYSNRPAAMEAAVRIKSGGGTEIPVRITQPAEPVREKYDGITKEDGDVFYLNLAKKTTPAYSFKPGAGFALVQTAARRELTRLLGLEPLFSAPRIPLNPRTLWSRAVPGGTLTKLILSSEPGCDMPVYLCVPEGKGPFPFFICLQGHGTGMHASLSIDWKDEKTFLSDGGDRDFAVQCLKKGYGALCIEQRAFGERSGRADHNPSCWLAMPHASLLGRTLIGTRVFDVDRGIDYLYTRSDVRRDRIGIVGNSGGGTTALYSGAILSRLTHVMPSSCFASWRDSILAKEHCICNYIPGIVNFCDMGDIAGLCAPKHLVLVNGAEDPIFPVASARSEFERTRKIYQASGVPERCAHVIGEGGHRFYADPAWKVMDEFLR